MDAKPPELSLESYELAAESLSITNDAEFAHAGQILKRIAYAAKVWTEYWDDPIKAATRALAAVRDKRNAKLKVLTKLRETYETAMSQYRLRAERNVVTKRADLDRLTEANQQVAEKRAAKLMQAGKAAEAIRILEEAAVPALLTVPDPQVKLHDAPAVPVYEVEVVDLMALVKFIAAEGAPLRAKVSGHDVAIFEVRESVIRSMVSSMGEGFTLPGVKITKRYSYRPRTEGD